MERPRNSSGSSTTTITSGRPSWDSRQKSPLSITTSMNYISNRRGVDSSISAMSNERPVSAGGNAKQPFAEIVQVPRSGSRRYTGPGRQKPPLIDLIPSQNPGSSPISPTSPMSPQKSTAQSTSDSFRELPEEILLVVLAALKMEHLSAGSTSCATCYTRDLVALALSCRKWWCAVRSILYEDIQLVGNDSVQHTKKFRAKYGCRLRLLRRTLSNRPDLALYVKSLKVPSMPEAARGRRERGEYIDLVGTLVMACPNLERLPDFYPAYNHEFTHFVHAMSTRPKLTEKVWIIDPSPSQRKRSEDSYIPEQSYLRPEQSIDFLTYHSNWSHLSTLVLHCSPDGIMDSALLIDVFDNLPSLQHLYVSSFPTSGFNDTNLISLPPLQSLRLESLPGITSNGLSTYGSLASSNTLVSLSLINTSLLSLPVLARLFSHLISLTSFTLSQHASPILPPNTDIFLYPYLASPTLKYLHWEITCASNTATSILSKSITSNGFPSLHTIRSPTDSEGIIQSICKPRERIEMPTDRYRNEPLTPQTPSLPFASRSFSFPGIMSPTRSTFPELSPVKTPTRTTYPEFSITSPTLSLLSFETQLSTPAHSEHSSISECTFRSTSLITARLQAQARLETAQLQPKSHIMIWDTEGSKIRYSLEPDVEGSEDAVIGMGKGERKRGGDMVNEVGGGKRERLFAIQDPNSIPSPNPPTIPDLTISLTSRHTLISSHLATLHHLLRTLKSELQLQLQNQKPENLEMESARKEWQNWDWERETETIERVKGMLGEVLTLLWELEAEMEWWE
ncbi:hypothetical protein B7494_g2868, partial [Chlorociboria aeruginascens]